MCSSTQMLLTSNLVFLWIFSVVKNSILFVNAYIQNCGRLAILTTLEMCFMCVKLKNSLLNITQEICWIWRTLTVLLKRGCSFSPTKGIYHCQENVEGFLSLWLMVVKFKYLGLQTHECHFLCENECKMVIWTSAYLTLLLSLSNLFNSGFNTKLALSIT